MAPNFKPLKGLPPKTFETERLQLSAFERTDVQLIFDLYASDPIATRYMSFPIAKTPSDVEFYVQGTAAYFEGIQGAIKGYTWKIFSKEKSEYVGSLGYGPKNDYTLVGGYILNPKFWGLGYATEAWCCIVDWAKEQPGVFRIEANFHPDNPASGRVMEKAGMAYEGLARRSQLYPNISSEPLDAIVYAWARA